MNQGREMSICKIGETNMIPGTGLCRKESANKVYPCAGCHFEHIPCPDSNSSWAGAVKSEAGTKSYDLRSVLAHASQAGCSLAMAQRIIDYAEEQAGAVSSLDRFASCSKNEPCTPAGCEAGQGKWPRCPPAEGAVKSLPTDFPS